MTMKPDPEILRSAIAHYRDRSFADLIVLTIGLATQTHPTEIRQALASVFDLAAVENATRRATAQLHNVQTEAQTLRHQIQDMRREVERLQQEINMLH